MVAFALSKCENGYFQTAKCLIYFSLFFYCEGLSHVRRKHPYRR